ncbi:TonB-dependent receptor [Sphingomonas koreensis]|nr:TonB-dependent receptor [Sphingomonas koreensis]
MQLRLLLLSGSAIGALTTLPAAAQTAPDPQAADTQTAAPVDDDGQNDIVVTGTRTAGRTRLDSVSPVDVLSAGALQHQGTTEVAAALASVAPSIDFPRPAVVDGTDAIRPATLRGLSPDQTLVLINGVRGHQSALLNVNGSIGRGSAAVDLNTIPTSALESIEVLRDGASALYGSDAIAGVVNLRLRQARTGGGASVTFGGYATDVDTALDDRQVFDGGTTTASAWQNIPIGASGYLDVTGEYVNRNPTSRGDIDPRVQPGLVRSRFGDPDVNQYTGYANLGVPIGDSGWQVVGWGGYQYRRTQSAAFPRVRTNPNNVASIYPDGFLPLIQTKSRDFTGTGGIKGAIGDWDTSLTASYGKDKIDFATLHSLNATYGADSQTSFKDGSLAYDQFVTNLDLSHDYSLGGDSDVTVAAGAEYRREGYKITAGEHASYDRGPLDANTALTGGAQGFIGFSPANEVDQHRDNVSGYLDLEGKFSTISIGLAGRVEHYSDFGTTANGKLSARWDITPSFALRGGVQTGFRAPSLQQEYFTSIASVVQDGVILETGTYPSVSDTAKGLGGLPLEPEKSTNFSAGFVFRKGPFNLSVDGYQITVRNGLTLSENLGKTADNTQLNDILDSLGVQAARFFINGVKTRARGVDVIANYRLHTDTAGLFDFTLAGNYNDIQVLKFPTNTAVNLDMPPVLFARTTKKTIEDGTPPYKVTGTLDWSLADVGITLRGTYYGDAVQPGSVEANDLHTGKSLITDLEFRVTAGDQYHFAVGANNLFDVYPNKVPIALDSTGVTAFPFYSPYGFNGRYLYVRVGVDW